MVTLRLYLIANFGLQQCNLGNNYFLYNASPPGSQLITNAGNTPKGFNSVQLIA
jgi:hypothetical protein